ncbi:unknown [Firmicutes bacterium CAG:882]|nr:unknown [Firmicutes bacterium CAG:882]
MDKIINRLMSCGYTCDDAEIEADKMVEMNRWDGAEMCSREYAIQMVLDAIEEE